MDEMKLAFAIITAKGILGNNEPAMQDRHYTISPSGLYLPTNRLICPNPGEDSYPALNLEHLNGVNTGRA
jgi:hypothetical protein